MIGNDLRDDRPLVIGKDLKGIVMDEFPALVIGEFLEDFHIGFVDFLEAFLVMFGFEDFVGLHHSV